MPTVRGWSVLAAGLALAAVGLVAGYRELVLLGLAAVVGVVLAGGWVGLPPPVAAQRAIAPDRVSRGDACQATVALHSATARSTLLTLTEHLAGPGEPDAVITTVRVPGGRSTRVAYGLPTDRRGVLTVGPLHAGRRDPLGLCAAERQLAPPARVLVRPRWQHLAAVPLGTVPSLDGLLDTAPHGSITFHALREYRFGDELRRIHWRTSARLGTLMVREHVDAALPRLTVLVDDRAESYRSDPDALEEVVEAAASVLVAADRDRLPVALRAASQPGVATTVGGGLDLLAQVQLTGHVDLTASLRRLRREHAGDTLVVLAGPAADLGPVVRARDAYAGLVVGLLGAGARPPSVPEGTVSLAASTAAALAGRWNQLAGQ